MNTGERIYDRRSCIQAAPYAAPACTIWFFSFILDRCRYHDRRRNLNDATQDLVWQFDPVWECQRRILHLGRKCRTIGDAQSVETILGRGVARWEDCYANSGRTGLAFGLLLRSKHRICATPTDGPPKSRIRQESSVGAQGKGQGRHP
jgi:hypothetical protein